jgi:hypothetical protein
MIQKICKSIFRHKDIVKDGILYLRRHYLSWRVWPTWWPIKRLPLIRVFLHLIKMPDTDRHPHDHPWSFLTIILWGGYWEAVYQNKAQLAGEEQPLIRYLGPGSVVFRRAEHTHQIIKINGSAAWTLVFAGSSRRAWGFWGTDGKFIPSGQYLKREDGSAPDQLPEDRVQ